MILGKFAIRKILSLASDLEFGQSENSKRLFRGSDRIRASALVSMTLLKNVVLWDRSPLRSTGVPNLFGVLPLRRQFADEKAPNKLGSPTMDAFFNRVLDTLRYSTGGALTALDLNAQFHHVAIMKDVVSLHHLTVIYGTAPDSGRF